MSGNDASLGRYIRTRAQLAAEMLRFVERVAALPKDGEGTDDDGEPLEMESDEAYDTVHELIDSARKLLGLPADREHSKVLCRGQVFGCSCRGGE